MCNVHETALKTDKPDSYTKREEEYIYADGAGDNLKEKEYQASLDSDQALLNDTKEYGGTIKSNWNSNGTGKRRLSEIKVEKQKEFSKLASSIPQNDVEVDRWIRRWIRVEVRSLHSAYPWLQPNRSNIAWAFTIISILIYIGIFYLHFHGQVSSLTAITIGTLTTATLHEIEHDVFHCQYLWRPKSLQFEIAMWLIYIFKFHVSPWWRMEYHLLHHQESGQKFDIEERLLGLGLPIGILRLVVTLTPLSYFLVVGKVLHDNPGFVWYRPLTESKFQLSVVGMSLLSVILYGLNTFLPDADITAQLNNTIPDWLNKLSYTVLICCVAVSHFRHVCLTLVTTFTHYYGDIQKGIVHEQIQILDSAYLIPLHVFCWFFGESHWIHHFYVQQPFWERCLISWEVNKAAKSELWRKIVPNSVRVNDFPTLEMKERPNARFSKSCNKKNI